MDSTLRLLVAVGLVAVAGVAVFGGAGPAGGPLVLLVSLVVLVGGLLLLRRPGRGLDLGWAARGAGAADIVVALPPGASGPVGVADVAAPRPAASPRQVAAALGRAEARRWLASPWFAAGIGLLVFEGLLFGWAWVSDYSQSWRYFAAHFPVMAHPLVGMAVVAAHAAVTRSRRDGTVEMLAACPAEEHTRTAGHLRAAWVPLVPAAAYVVVVSGLVSVRNDRVYGPLDGRALADALTAVVLAGCGAWLGVALARWAPWRLAPVVTLAVLVPVIQGLGNIGEPHWSNARQLSSWPRYPQHELLFTAPPVWWHLVWLAGLGGLTGVVALAHARRGRGLALAGGALALVTLAAGIAQTRPVSSGTAARLASLVAEPERHQTCRTGPRLRVCAYDGFGSYARQALAAAAPVAAAAPSATGPFVLRQVFDGDLDALGPEVARALAVLDARKPTTELPLGFHTSDGALTIIRLTVALRAVGLPVRSGADAVPVVIAGQARGVVLLWLAARGLDPAAARRSATSTFVRDEDINNSQREPTAVDFGMAWPDGCGESSSPVAWSAQDLAGARALLGQPEERVRRLLHRDWARFTDPATTTDQLLAAAGLAPVGPPDRIDAVPLKCSY